MSEASPRKGRDGPGPASHESALAEDPRAQSAADAAHGSTGWNAYEVWRERVFVPQGTGYKKPRGNP